MKISFMTQAYGAQPFEEIVARLAAVGYDGVEPLAGPAGQLKPGELGDADRRGLRAMLADHGMAIPVVNPYQESMVLMGRDGTARQFYGDIMDLAVDVGASTVNFISGFLPEGDTEAWRIVIRTLKELTSYAESIGVNLSMHNHEANILDTPDKCALMIHHVASPRLTMTFDATNCHIVNGNVVRAIEDHGAHIVHCHLKGIRGRYPENEFRVPGDEEDEMDFRAIADALGRVGYGGYVSVETFQNQRDDKDRVAYSMIDTALRERDLRD